MTKEESFIEWFNGTLQEIEQIESHQQASRTTEGASKLKKLRRILLSGTTSYWRDMRTENSSTMPDVAMNYIMSHFDTYFCKEAQQSPISLNKAFGFSARRKNQKIDYQVFALLYKSYLDGFIDGVTDKLYGAQERDYNLEKNFLESRYFIELPHTRNSGYTIHCVSIKREGYERGFSGKKLNQEVLYDLMMQNMPVEMDNLERNFRVKSDLWTQYKTQYNDIIAKYETESHVVTD